jgi:hypothetical protein
MVCKQRRSDVHAIYTLIAANQAELPIATMCNTLQVSKSGYYDWHERAPSDRENANIKLLEQIKAAHTMSYESYGMPRVRAELADAAIVASRKRIAHLMRANGIQGIRAVAVDIPSPPGAIPKSAPRLISSNASLWPLASISCG